MFFPEDIIYRPPSEADSYILRITRGCTHNACSFCTMYRGKPFSVRPLEASLAELEALALSGYQPRRFFLADGNGLCLPAEHLESILSAIRRGFPGAQRVSCYAAPRDVLQHSDAALLSLCRSGLGLVYMGLESGSDTILTAVQKGVRAEEMVAAADKLRRAGIQMSVTVISGLGGRALWESHARETAQVLNQMQPQYLGLLTLMLAPEAPLYNAWRDGRFELLSAQEVLLETRLLIEGLSLTRCVFRSNHASNYVALSGNLPEDRGHLLSTLDRALALGAEALRPEHYRGL